MLPAVTTSDNISSFGSDTVKGTSPSSSSGGSHAARLSAMRKAMSPVHRHAKAARCLTSRPRNQPAGSTDPRSRPSTSGGMPAHQIVHEVVVVATELNTPLTRPAFSSVGTVRSPKWSCCSCAARLACRDARGAARRLGASAWWLRELIERAAGLEPAWCSEYGRCWRWWPEWVA